MVMRFVKMRFVISTILFTTSVFCAAQQPDTVSFKSFGVHGHYGFIIPHADEIEPVSGTNPAGVEINYNRINTSKASWNVFSAFWFSGVSAGYHDFGNSVTGGALFLTAYAEPVIHHGGDFFFSVRGGAGLSYHTSIFDTITNPANKFFATRISFPVYVSARFNYRLSHRTVITLAGNYNHISNGGIKQPNFGMNFPTFSLGLYHYQREFPVFHRNFNNERKIDPRITLTAQILSGYRVVDETDEYPEKGAIAAGVHIRAAKQLTGFYSLNAGAELIIDGAIREKIRREGVKLDHKRAALTAGQDFLFGRVVFSQYLGFYVYSPYKAFRDIYQKYELSFRISPAISAGTFLKAHLYIAELMGFNVSYTLTTSKAK